MKPSSHSGWWKSLAAGRSSRSRRGGPAPKLNSNEETECGEALYGKFRYKRCWSDFSKRPENTPLAFRAGYHEPDVVAPLVEGAPHTQPLDETAAHFIVRLVHQYPDEVRAAL